jgi:hypothetical protein
LTRRIRPGAGELTAPARTAGGDADRRGNAPGVDQPRGEALGADDPMLATGGIDPVVEVELHPGGSDHDEHGVGEGHPAATVVGVHGGAVGSAHQAHHSPS